MQGLLKCELSNHYIVNIRVIRIVFHLLILTSHNKLRIRVVNVSIITLINAKKCQFDIFHEISENIFFLQLMSSIGNFNHAVSIGVYWVFESNYKKAILLTLNLLNLVCYPLVGVEMFAMFEKLFYAVRYINNTGKLNISD